MDSVFLKKLITTSATQIVVVVLSAISVVLTARLLGPEGRGVLAILAAYGGMYVNSLYFSLGQVSANRAATEPRDIWLPRALGTMIFWIGLCTVLLIGTICIVRYFAIGPIGAYPMSVVLLAAASIPFMLWNLYSSSLLPLVDQINELNVMTLILRVVSVSLAVLLLAHGFQETSVLIASLIGYILASLYSVFKIGSVLKRSISLELVHQTRMILDGAKLQLNAFGSMLFTSANVLILGHYCGEKETGLYSTSMQFIQFAAIPAQAVSTIFYSQIAKEGYRAVWKRQKEMILRILMGLIPATFVSIFLLRPMIYSILGSRFSYCTEFISALMLVLPGMIVSMLVAPQWIARGFFWTASMASLLVGIISVFLNVFLVKYFLVQGALLATTLTYIIIYFSNTIAMHVFDLCDESFDEI